MWPGDIGTEMLDNWQTMQSKIRLLRSSLILFCFVCKLSNKLMFHKANMKINGTYMAALKFVSRIPMASSVADLLWDFF